ncbi:hypothetical protein GX50_06885 [[Emmonsia] crescens]|uniref:Uncharacterized protein n=1 Tax=[Emmonsia] crescens TaxID=73230 RepID=A0A2B7Z8W2_9EURO|nr:hypothetical protein GX50_06885 [Emmonsia crescens]
MKFGPRMYTASDFLMTKAYAGTNGAVMVFKNVDYHDLEAG